MPRVYLKYELPQESEEYALAYNGAKYKYALDELDEWLRNIIKYPNSSLTNSELKCYELCRDKLREIMNYDT